MELTTPHLASSTKAAPLLSVADTQRMMQCLEEIYLSHRSNEYLIDSQRRPDTIEKRVLAVRLALVSHLAVTLARPNSSNYSPATVVTSRPTAMLR